MMQRRDGIAAGMEYREIKFEVARPEVRADDDGTERFIGHACVFNQRTAIGNPLTWGFYEQCAKGMFKKTLKEADARFLIDHASYYVVSRNSAGTLKLKEDPVGLAVDSFLDTELTYVRDLKANIRNGNITGMSFGFYVTKDKWEIEEVEATDSKGNPIKTTVEVRTILEVKLVEVSAVTFPAYEGTDAGLRAQVRDALRARGDVEAMRARVDWIPDILPEEVETVHNGDQPEDSSSDAEREEDITRDEPGETTQHDGSERENGTEPAETTPSDEVRQRRHAMLARAMQLGLSIPTHHEKVS